MVAIEDNALIQKPFSLFLRHLLCVIEDATKLWLKFYLTFLQILMYMDSGY